MVTAKKIQVTEYNITYMLSRDYKFVFVSDLHGFDNRFIFEKIKERAPDALLVGGDFIHDANNYKSGLEFLKETVKHLPVYCCLGNHEFRFDEDMKPQILDTGVTILDNSYIEFEEIIIGGLTSAVKRGAKKDKKANKRIPEMEWLKEFSSIEEPKLLLCHHPEYYNKYLKKYPIDIILSGHAHGGQWRIFNRGIYAPGQGIFPKYTGGFYDERLIVSRGIGNPHLVPRINNKPEIIVLNIKKEDS
ncbi:MAG: metallophosphoesterase [Clostridia bacterium]|nr:metallophosphoesterase [Clostridia bacterium]